MQNEKHLQLLGYINKEVKLGLFKHTRSFEELILESRDLFSGYYNNPAYESQIRPRHVYFIIKAFPDIHNIRVIRATQKVKQNLPFSFDASPGQLSLFNKPAHFIRIRIDNFDNLPMLTKAYRKAGLAFVKHQPIKEYVSRIKVLNYFDLLEVEKDIYRSNDRDGLFYLIIEKEIKWDEFKIINDKVRNNFIYEIDEYFDAAPGFYYTKTGISDFIRIYARKDFPMQILRQIHKMFHEEIRNLDN